MNTKLKYNNAWKDKEYLWRREVNEQYNYEWINYYGFKNYKKVKIDKLICNSEELVDASDFQLTWLRNIDRLIDMMSPYIQPIEYELVDAGCGSGISTIYFAKNYPFSKFIGFDLSEILINQANKNLDLFFQKSKKHLPINFQIKNAKNYTLENKPYFVFMYNPFGFETAKKFLLNNLDSIVKNRSIFPVSNDIWIRSLLEMDLHKIHIRNDIYNLSLLIF